VDFDALKAQLRQLMVIRRTAGIGAQQKSSLRPPGFWFGAIPLKKSGLK
jgi:hypothetical protein